MIVWGGDFGFGNFLNTGGRYNPKTDSWMATSLVNVPSERDSHTAVWTGREMIVWGGGAYSDSNTGGRYNPVTDSWIATCTETQPRLGHTAVWTGDEMIVWGGYSSGYDVNTGARYDPSTNSWLETTTTDAPEGRVAHAAVWTGSEMIVWGGFNFMGSGFFNTGGRYNPTTDQWAVTATTNAPSPRAFSAAIWTGSEMIVWGL
ncbi:MAG: hypothetical protein DME59_17595 [Verrucomicrobia bacterium]|nr:MAG: hypothetical protein DME59_17595 [Verrucomicrobiota bacterium]